MNSNLKIILLIAVLVAAPFFLLVASVVGGAIFVTVQKSECREASSFQSQEVQIEAYGVSERGLYVSLKNVNAQPVEVNSVNVAGVENKANNTIVVGETRTYSFGSFNEAECSESDITVAYSTEGQQKEVSGTLEGKFSIE